ncbi:jg8449 [Pararge aegeria aegeria]|uniref:Jg8449 protein n=1 Tax=Pararge aegeria aegeria TaxID=348720 RepID=A0A8S4S545_9NEOP|nr:jg8449 [Pararge aegeria aegeria]
MDSNSVSPMPELAPIAEFDKSPPSPPNEEVPMDDLPPPPVTISQAEGKKLKVERWKELELCLVNFYVIFSLIRKRSVPKELSYSNR